MTTGLLPTSAPTTEDYSIRAADVSKSYGNAANPVHALRGVSLEVRRGERIALLGKSGCGKSTLLHILGGLDRPTTGTVWLAGHELAQMTPGDLARYRLKRVGMIFQAFNLIPSRSAWQNVELPMIFAGVAPQARRAAARQKLEAVGLGHRLNHRPNQLSGGEQQRVAIARALATKPKILLADEPTGNLDSRNSFAVLNILKDLNDRLGQTILMITHNADAAQFGHRIMRMSDGVMLSGQ